MAGPLIYADASAIMRLVDGDEPARQRVEALLRQHGGSVVTSVISMIECRSKPLRDGDAQRVSAYDAFFSSNDLALFPVNSAVAERATQLRATYNLKTPDAITSRLPRCTGLRWSSPPTTTSRAAAICPE